MGSIQNTGSVTATVTASILRAANDNIAIATSMLKKATDADKNLVNTLLPPSGGGASGLDIRA